MRHHLVVNLQPISMIYEVLDRGLKAEQPNLAQIHDSAGKINGFARAALASSLDVITWLAPEDSTTATLSDGVAECVGLLGSNFSFRGYSVRNDVQAPGCSIRRVAIRHVLTGAMMAVADSVASPAEFVLSGGRDGAPVLVLTVREGQGAAGVVNETNYRPLMWEDVQAMAGAEGVTLAREGGTVTFTFPLAA